MNIIIHLNEGSAEKQSSAIRNIHHALENRPGKDTFELVAHGPGITLVTGETSLESELKEVLERGVAVVACHNSLVSLGRSDSEVFSGVTIVPSGIAHIIERQANGWGYVKI